MPIAEVTILPMGVGTSVSRFVAAALRVLEDMGIEYMLTPMSTVFQAGDLETVFEAVRRMHEAVIEAGAPRVEMILKVDDRRDKRVDMHYKVRSTLEKLREKRGPRPGT